MPRSSERVFWDKHGSVKTTSLSTAFALCRHHNYVFGDRVALDGSDGRVKYALRRESRRIAKSENDDEVSEKNSFSALSATLLPSQKASGSSRSLASPHLIRDLMQERSILGVSCSAVETLIRSVFRKDRYVDVRMSPCGCSSSAHIRNNVEFLSD